MPDTRKDADVFVRRNYLSLQDNYVQLGGEEEDMFISVSGQRETIDDYEIGDQKVVRVYFRIDPYINSYERQVYSSGDFLAQIGGIFSFLKAIGAFFVFIFSERLLVSALAGKLYQVYDEKKGNDKYDEDPSADLNDSIAKLKSFKKSEMSSSNRIMDISATQDEEKNFYKRNPVRNLFKNTVYCRNKSAVLADKLKNDKELDEIDRLKIKNLVSNRKRFDYNTFHVLQYIICCVACRQRRNKKKWKRHLLYKKAEDKVFEQLDVVNILKWIEQLKLLTKGLLNHKQKFWLKFQKEHLLEIEENSDKERKEKLKEETRERDFIKLLYRNDPRAKKRVDRMLKYLQHGNRTAFDQKIIGGLFEEYASDSEEEEMENRVMDTEEEKKEFYSLALQDEPQTRRGQFNKGVKSGDVDFQPLKNLYNSVNSITALGYSSPKKPDKSSFKKKGGTKSFHRAKTKKVFSDGTPLNQLSSRKKNSSRKRHKDVVSSKSRGHHGLSQTPNIQEEKDDSRSYSDSDSNNEKGFSQSKFKKEKKPPSDVKTDDKVEKIIDGALGDISQDKIGSSWVTKDLDSSDKVKKAEGEGKGSSENSGWNIQDQK
mmetsp:Transcript_27842/g.27715  ORF Transcript_27842/g.27715 Transcript_27842/m.27715 type:complete len:597 (-) Transcript_27842:87-1877(-)